LKKKKSDSGTPCFWKIVPNWVYFGQGEDFKLTTERKSAIFLPPSNQKQLKGSNTAYVHK